MSAAKGNEMKTTFFPTKRQIGTTEDARAFTSWHALHIKRLIESGKADPLQIRKTARGYAHGVLQNESARDFIRLRSELRRLAASMRIGPDAAVRTGARVIYRIGRRIVARQQEVSK